MLERNGFYFVAFLFWIGHSALWGQSSDKSPVSGRMVRRIQFAGNSAISSADLEKRLSIKRLGPFTSAQVQFSRDLIISIFRDHGYAEVRVSTQVEEAVPG